MGLIKAGMGAAGGALADQWREYFYCEALDADTLASKGQVRINKKRSSNTKANDNIISNGSIIAVNDGQFMIIVEQGKIVEFCGEPGEFTYDTSTEPTMLYGGFGKGLKDTFSLIGKRFTFGGDTAKDQRVYYFNTKEILNNKYGTPSPVPFRVVDKNIGLDVDIAIGCFGEYSYKLVDPMLFYKNVCGNVESDYKRDQLDPQLKSELMTALQPAFAKISDMGIRYSAIPAHTQELSDVLNEVLSEKWSKARGIAIASLGVSSVKASEEDEQMIKDLQRKAVMKDPTMAAASLVDAQSEAMVGAAKNPTAGPMMAFAGMNMAQNAGGMNAATLFEMGKNQGGGQPPAGGTPAPQAPQGGAGGASAWTCECGAASNTGKFCESCGKPKPEVKGWACECGAVNQGKFCMECGKPKPAGAPVYKCDKCGWEPKDGEAPPKFCPECGDSFDENDAKK